jgi:outer membrane protein OmpA-like peptidoglycan-associated protein
VLDGNGECALAANGSDICNPPAPVIVPVVKVAPIAIVVPAPPVRIVKNVSLSGDALFANNSAVLTDAGKAAVDPIIAEVFAITKSEVSLVGHADSRAKNRRVDASLKGEKITFK